MTEFLTPEQLKAMDASISHPFKLVDPRNQADFVLIPASDFRSIQDLIDDERLQRSIRNIGIRNAARRMTDEP